MDTVRIARDFGTVSELLPAGVVSLLDAPHSLVGLLKTTMVFLSWQDNLPNDEMPPRRIWLNEKKLKRFFKDMDKKREAEMKGKGNDVEGWDGELVSNGAAMSLLIEDD